MADELTPDEVERALMRQFPGINARRARELAQRSTHAVTPSAPAEPPTPKRPVILPLKFTLPWSALVSDNDKYSPAMRRSAKGELYPVLILTSAYRDAKAKARRLAKEATGGAAPLAIPLALHARVWVPNSRPGHDVCNFAKCAHDAFESVVYVTDEWLYDPRWTRIGVDVDAPRAEITITLALPTSP